MYANSVSPPRPYRVGPALVVALVAAGVAVRVWVLTSPLGALDADEAVVGLMARRMPEELPAFYWGQRYGGPAEAWIASVVFRVAGTSVGALKAVPVALSAVASVLVWRVGRRTVGEHAGRLAGVLFWVWPAAFVWWSTKERAFYWSTLVLGLVALLLVLRLAVADGRRWWPEGLGIGAAAGLGWWTSPQIVYLLVPAGVWLVARRPRKVPRLVVALPAFVLFACPWVVANLRSGWSSFAVPPQPVSLGYLGHLRVLFVDGLPQALGLKTTWHLEWLHPVVAPAAYGAALALFGLAVARALRGDRARDALPGDRARDALPGDRARDALPVVAVAAIFPLLFAASPYSWYVLEPRYLLYVAPAVALLVAWGLACVRWGAVVGAAAAVGMTVWGIAAVLSGPFATPAAPDARLPAHMGPLVAVLSERGVDRVFANYWLAYRLTFESDERIVAASAASMSRYEPYERAVRGDDDPAFVFVDGSALVGRFEEALRRRDIAFERLAVGGFVVHVPEEKVVPEDVPEVWTPA